MSGDFVVEMRAIEKRFGGVQALDGADLLVRRGSIHALLGENGAGKSTLVKILAGIVQRDGGTIRVEGNSVDIPDPVTAVKLGIGVALQERSLLPKLTVAENIFLRASVIGMAPARGRLNDAAAEILSQFPVRIDPSRPIGELSVAEQQIVEIAKALVLKPKVLIFDEACSALSVETASTVFHILRRFASSGGTCIYISHRLDEVYGLCDSVTILRDGRTVLTSSLSDLRPDEVVAAMAGRALNQAFPPKLPHDPERKPVLRLLRVSGEGFEEVTLSVCRGEVVGLGGLQGQGQSALLKALFGLAPLDGRVELEGKAISIRSPQDAMRLGIAFVPGDRKVEGLCIPLSVRENLALPSLSSRARAGLVDRRTETRVVHDIVERIRLKSPSVEAPVSALSGGNQQKLVLGKWLPLRPRLLLLDDPMRGVDVQTKDEMYRLLRTLASQGAAVLMTTSDTNELVGLCDRAYIMNRGRIVSHLSGQSLTLENVVAAAFEGRSQTPGADAQ